MTKPGRNDSCPCGSGKKYKKCCLVSVEDADFRNRRTLHVENDLIPRLLIHAIQTFGKESLMEASEEFYDEECEEPTITESPMNAIFMPWFLFNWTTFTIRDGGGSMPFETTVAESFLRTYNDQLSQDEQLFLVASNRSPHTFCEITEVTPGVGMKQFDLLRRVEYEVTEKLASQTLQRGDIIYCAPTVLEGVTSNQAMGPYALRPLAKRDVLELRKWIMDHSGSDAIRDAHLDEYEPDIRDLYLDWVDQMLNPDRQITNTDGHPLVLQKLYFDIESADQAFHALKDLAEGIKESDLLSQAQMEEGRVVSVRLPWFGGSAKAKKRLRGLVLLGNIRIDDTEMVVEVNSDERAEMILQQIAERLGESATYKSTQVEPLETQFAAAGGGDSEDADFESNAPTSGFLSMKDAPPELLREFERMNREHWEAWFEEPIPALNHMTPREASQTEEGRDLLSSLLFDYERRQSHSPENIYNPDIPALRRDLGLE
jgi:hypothetical protein